VNRERPLDPPHKGLRHQLGLLVLDTGRTDWSSASEVASLKARAAFTFRLLAEHAANEDDHLFLALEQRAPGACAAVEAEHPGLADAAGHLAERFAQLQVAEDVETTHELYLDLTCYQAEYLEHLAHEERQMEPLLLRYFDDEELAGIQVAIAESSDPTLLLDWFEVCVPARSDPENTEVLHRMRSALPPEAFAAIAARLAQVLPAERFDRLVGPLL
jgi:Hemerythrin HHE cation binding domain